MAGAESHEAASAQSEEVSRELQEFHDSGLDLSSDVEAELKNNPDKHITDMTHLGLMSGNMRSLETFRTQKLKGPDGKEMVTPVSDQDIDFVEGNLRRITSLGEIKGKYDKLNKIYHKYVSLKLAILSDSRLAADLRMFAKFSPKDIEKANSLPPLESAQWVDNHVKRVNLLNDLAGDNIVHITAYATYRAMEPDEALEKLKELKEKTEKKDKDSADKILDEIN